MNQVVLLHTRLQAVAVLFAVSVVAGCDSKSVRLSTHDRGDSSESYLSVISGAEFETQVRRSERPVLVEFGVNFGCDRCDQMRPEMVRLAREFEGLADVVRIDFNSNRQLAAQFGATICPSYVLFDHGQVVTQGSFPTSADVLASDLESILENDDEGR